MRTTGLSSLPLLLVLMLNLEAAAQVLPDVVPGQRIRVALFKDPQHKRTGICDSLSSEVLFITLENSGRRGKVPLATIASLEVCRKTGRKTWMAASVGTAVGAIAGGVVGSAVGQGSDPQYAGLHALAGVVIGAPSGFLLGAVIGSQIKSEQWEKVALKQAEGGDK